MRLLGNQSSPVRAVRTTRAPETIASSIPRSVASKTLGRLTLPNTLVAGEFTQRDAIRSEIKRTHFTKGVECATFPRQFSAGRDTRRVTGSASLNDSASSSKTQQMHIMEALEQQLGSPISAEPLIAPPKPHVFLISGASGVGKDAVIQRLQELRPDLHFVVTATSRAMRPGEVEGKDYYFVSKEEFEKMIADGELLEHAVVYGQYKGLPKTQIREALSMGTDCVLRLDVQGAATMRKLMPGIVTIFLVAESEKVLVERLVGRQTEAIDSLAVRVATARDELARFPEFDYVLVNENGKLDETADLIGRIIDVEKRRTHRPAIQL
eukprot:CAMPEP_0118956564 /NCGR_PEP_ID=MMETSP1169-20130426/61647_1 /TAXON_ID=36882 /ORGANISM="Pyramimonas obovata, Strain CCMP722" /LENGTH=323 /DNA_ID=CAMNT_0006904599 /DNA_START=62 /DNA_END=1033 /DNA_ORIENTATION=-